MLNLHSYKKLLLVLGLINFNLHAQLIPEISKNNLPSNNLQAQIDQLQDQLDYLRQNLPRPSIRSAPQSYSQPPHKAMAGTAGCLDCGDSSSESRCLERESDSLTCLKKENDKFPSTSTKPVTFTQHKFTEDFTVDLFTNLQVDYFAGHALELFNRNSYDDYMFTQGALDFGIDIAKIAGPRRHELFFDIRAKGVFGNSGIFNGTVPRPIKIGLGRTENSYSFQPALQNLWLRELWFKYNINPQYHTDLQIGFFPYAIGSGLTLGNGYKVGKLIPGYYEERFVDQFRPGVMLTGDIWPEKLKYKIYAGLRANCSSNFYDTAQFTYSQDPSWRSKPERGSFFNNTVGAFEIEYHSERKNIQTDVRPFIIINQENFQQVEFPGDASSTLGILGINLEAKKDRWSFFFESALNFGSQQVKAWDRDFVQFISNPTHTYLFQDFSTTTAYNPCWKQAVRTPCPEDTAYNYYNGQEFKDSNNILYKNAFDRYRQEYQNSYHGLMFYTEAAYHKLHPTKLGVQTTFAMAAGYASGDENPNDSFEKLMAIRLYGNCDDYNVYTGYVKTKDYNKPYQGFVGVDQMFMNRDVYSVFMLESQKLNRPLATSESRLTYPLFTNLAFLGLGAKYDQIVSAERAFTFRFNALTYWQATPTNKGYSYGLDILFALGSCGYAATNCFTPQLQADACKTMSQHLGSEINCAINYQFDQNLNFYFSGAAFIPGSYYRDIAGKIIPLEVQYQLASVDYSGYEMNKQKYDIALNNSTALIFNIGFGYSFDTAPKQHAVFSKDLQANLATLKSSSARSVISADTIINSSKLDIKPVATPIAIITPITARSPRLSTTELELLETLQYKAPTIKPVQLTSSNNSRVQIVKLPKVTAPKMYSTNYQHLPSARPEVYRGMLRAQSIALTSTANLNNQTINTPNTPASSTPALAKANSFRYKTPATRSIVLVTPATNLNTLELPTVSATNLAVNLTPVTKLRYQAPVTRKTKLAATKVTALITPIATQVITPITARSPKLSTTELELLETLQYTAPTIKPVQLTSSNNSRVQIVKLPKVITPKVQKLPNTNYQVSISTRPVALTSSANLNNQTINTPNTPASSTPALAKASSLRYKTPVTKSIVLATPATNLNTLELPAIAATNLAVNLAPVTKLKYQAPVTHKTKLAATKVTASITPIATQVITPITARSPRLSTTELELLETLQYKAPTIKPVQLTSSNNSRVQIVKLPKVTTSKVQKLSNTNYQVPISTKPVTLTSSSNLRVQAINTPKVITPNTPVIAKTNSLRYKTPVTKSIVLATPATNLNTLELPAIAATNLAVNLAPVTKLKYQAPVTHKTKLAATKVTASITPIATQVITPITARSPRLSTTELELLETLQYTAPTIKPVILASSNNLRMQAINTPKVTALITYALPEISSDIYTAQAIPADSYLLKPKSHKLKLEIPIQDNTAMLNFKQPKVTSAPLIITKLNLIITTPAPTAALSSTDLANLSALEYQVPIAQFVPLEIKFDNLNLDILNYQTPKITRSQLAVTKTHRPIATPEISLQTVTTAPELALFEYQAPTVKPSKLAIANNSSNRATKLNLPEATVPELATTPELDIFAYQTPKITKSRLLITSKQAPTNKFTLPEVATSQFVTLPKVVTLDYQTPKTAKTYLTKSTNSDTKTVELDLPTINLLELEIYQPTTKPTQSQTKIKIKSKAITPARTTAPLTEIDASLLSYEIMPVIKPVTLANNSKKENLSLPNTTAPKSSYQKPERLNLHTPSSNLHSNSQLAVTKTHRPIATPEVSLQKVTTAPELEVFAYQIPKITKSRLLITPKQAPTNKFTLPEVATSQFVTLPKVVTLDYQTPKTAKTYFTKSANSDTKTVELDLPTINLLELEIYQPTTKPAQSQAKIKIKSKAITPARTTASLVKTAPLTEIDTSLLSYEIMPVIKPVTLATNPKKENLSLPNTTAPKSSYQKPEILNLHTPSSNLHSNSQLAVTKTHRPIETPDATVAELTATPELELFEYQAPEIKPSKLAIANNSRNRATKLNLPEVTVPELATAPELEIFVYQTPKITKSRLLITPKQASTNKFTLPEATIIKAENLPELEIFEYQAATIKPATAHLTYNHNPNSQLQTIELPEINLLELEISRLVEAPRIITTVKTKASQPKLAIPTPVRTRKSRSDFEDSSLDEQELELLKNYKQSFAI